MASLSKILPANVPGELFVDSTCIDCDTCRQLAPRTFGEADGYSFVEAQPQNQAQRRDGLRALVACPTGSIGQIVEKAHRETPDAENPVLQPRDVLGDFPLEIEGGVYYCGFNSPKSYGGNSYFIRHAAGNWLVDSPKFLPQLVKRLEGLGGLAYIFLTHRDDVADAERYARHFGATRIIHRAELSSQPSAEWIIEGVERQELAPGFVAIPTPGHTRGHMVLLYSDTFLFTGDHLAWDRDEERLIAFHDYCWHSWPQQIESMAALAGVSFSWVLPGHGQRVRLSRDAMRPQMLRLIERMQAQAATV